MRAGQNQQSTFMHLPAGRGAAPNFWAFLFTRLLLFVGGAAAAVALHAGWPIETPDLHPDPAWHWGTLPNGLRYVVRQNALPAGRVSYRFVVQVGAMHETPAERGFAHFVEHMAFNGTRRFPGESLQAEMEKRGIGFGPESSAFTFHTHTIFQFDAPGNRPAEIDWVLGVLREFADGVTFEPKQVKRERGVIESESRDRHSAGQRFQLKRRRELYPLSPLSNNIEGEPGQATAETLRAFYRKWYRPERMILAVVGDAPPEELAAAIERQFASLPARHDAAPSVDLGFLGNPAQSTTNLLHDPEAAGLWLEVVSLTPTRPDSLAERRRTLAANIATQVLTERLQVIARERADVFGNPGARILAASPHAYETNVFLQSTSVEWAAATTTLARELRRTLELTVYEAEARDAKARILRGGELAVAAAATADSDDLAGEVMQEALWGFVSIGPAENLRLAREILPTVTVREVAEAWRSFWEQGRARLFGYGYFPIRNANALIDEAFSKETHRKLEPPPKPKAVAFPYSDFGPPGEVRTQRHDAATDLHLLEFANGVRVSLKRTSFEANQVLFAAALGPGLRSAPPYKPALGPVATATFLNGGVARLTPDELHHFFSIEPVTMQFVVGEGAFQFSGTTPPAKIELMLRLLCAYLSSPRWDEKALAGAKVALASHHNELLKTSEGVLNLHAFHEATQRDPRYRAPTPEEVAAIGVADLRNWLDPVLSGAPIDFALVGDFDPEAVVPILARTLGALPARESPRIEQFPIRFAKSAHEFSLPGPAPSDRAAVQLLWAADQGRDVHASRRLEVLSAILNNRLIQRVREDLGAAYAPSASYWRTEAGTEEGYLSAFATTAPKLANKVRKLILQEADRLATRGATAAELAEALNPILARTRVQLKGNSYWLWHIALRAHQRPEVLTWPATRTTDFEQITLADVNALAAEVLRRDHALQFAVVPGR